MAEFGGHLMISKLTRPCIITLTDYSLPTIFKEIKKDALIIVDNTRLHNLVTAVATAVDGGYFHRCGVVLLLDSSVAANNDDLTSLNIRMRALWSAGLAVLKPWTWFLSSRCPWDEAPPQAAQEPRDKAGLYPQIGLPDL